MKSIRAKVVLLAAFAVVVAAALVPTTAMAAGTFVGGVDQYPAYVLNDHTPVAVHFTAAGLTPSTTYNLKIRYTPGLTPGGVNNRGFTWNPTSGSWTQERDALWSNFPSVTTDASGAIASSSGWAWVKFGDDAKSGDYHLMISLQSTANATFNSSIVPTVTVLDPTTNGGWVHNGAAVASNKANKRVAVTDPASSTIISLQKSEAQGVDDDSNGVVDDEHYGPGAAAGSFRMGVPTATPIGVSLNQLTWTEAAGFVTGGADVDIAAGSVTDTAAPTAPAALLVASGDTTAALSWTPASDNTTVTGYYIYRWQAAPIDATYTNPHARIATLAAGVTSYADSGLTNGGTYYYEVRAFDAATNVGPRATGSAAPVIAAPSVSTVPTSPDGDDGWYKTKPIVTIHTGATRTTLYSFQAIPSSWTTYTAPIEIPEGLSTLKYLDTDGVSMGTSATLSFKVDSIKPTASVSAPAISVPTSKDKTIVVSWQGADAGSGVERFQVQSRILPSGTWEDGYETTETAAYFTGDAGANYEFHVRAFDAAGNAGDWSAVVSTIIPFDQTVAKYSSGWKVAKNSNYYLGSARYTTKKGAYATTSFTKGTLYLVTKTGPKLGKLAVYYRGKKVGTVDLHSKSTKYRQVFKLISKTSGSASTVKLVNLGVSGHKQVEIDGLALKR